MKIAETTVLITGANRGIGLAFSKAFLARGARKVYAAARDPSRIDLPDVTPLPGSPATSRSSSTTPASPSSAASWRTTRRLRCAGTWRPTCSACCG